jgi:hypothetical protein
MFHPLLADPRKIKDQDLENKILDLSKKYHIAARSGQGSVANQILVALETYKEEQRRRQHIASQTVIKDQNNKGLDDLINVD